MSNSFLPTPLRRALEKAIRHAREVAETAAAEAVGRLRVAEPRAPDAWEEPRRALRRALRAHARALGDQTLSDGGHETERLVEAAAYAHWHRRLFARFLAERGLLRHAEHDASVTLEECDELAPEEGFADGWAAAEAYAARMLPAVFRADDPALALVMAPEHDRALRRLVLDLDAAVFQADDSLGWTYQFWRAAEKDRVNKAGGKIGARELPAVTQLFTEPYMVKFLLHNTLGAWRAGKVLAARPELVTEAADEAALRAAVSPPGYAFDMLRFVREGEDAPRWRPAAGTFPGWPETAAAIRALDPCCGSGHFLTEMLAILAALRADEEGLADAAAVAAVLRDNLFGLELDGRCVQIAAFAVALAAWRIGGYQPIAADALHVAWVGAPPPLERPEFEELGNGDEELRYALGVLHGLFAQAPLLGSLLEPTGGDLLGPKVVGKLDSALPALVKRTRVAEPERAEGAVSARRMADALAILGSRYILVATNVPFLGRGKQTPDLAAYIARTDADAKADLATAMLSRSLRLLAPGGTTAAVTPQNWLFLGGYKHLRARLLDRTTLNLVGALGPRAFETITGEVVNTALVALSAAAPDTRAMMLALDANDARVPAEKAVILESADTSAISQSGQKKNPDARISTAVSTGAHLLSKYALSVGGTTTSDSPRFRLGFWEPDLGPAWTLQVTSTDATLPWSGRNHSLLWEAGKGEIARRTGGGGSTVAGREVWGRSGIAVRYVGDLPGTLYNGEIFENIVAVVCPHDASHLPAIWSLIESSSFLDAVRSIDKKMGVTCNTLAKIPFDLAHWTAVAAERYPDGLPEPYTDDPTQWLFHGHPAQAEAGTRLHVALARLAGYRWPAESDSDMRLSTEARGWIARAAILPAADADGLLPLPAVGGERPLHERLAAYLDSALGSGWDEPALVRAADERFDKRAGRELTLEAWLRDRAFRQHANLFHNRPFLWHVWDGQKDGFSAMLHYHRLTRGALEKLTFTTLGDWKRRIEGDNRRLEAAEALESRLKRILDGDDPYDIFVRWKPLARQPFGWDPDLDDGVRLNIRPWVQAGVLREPHPKGLKWGVDRGSDVASAPWFPVDKGKRNNDRHTTLADKQAARARDLRSVTPLDALADALVATGDYIAAAEAPPEAVLWCDPRGEFAPLLPPLRERLPQLLTLGSHEPATRTGPALWLRSVAVGGWPDGPALPEHTRPIVYLPGLGRGAVRPMEDGDILLRPLAWWSVAGRFFGHVNGKDWTLRGFLAAERGPLRLDVPDDVVTREALARAAPMVFARPVETLRERRLDADALDALAAPDVMADMLDWMEGRLDAAQDTVRFKAFAQRSSKALGFDPRKLGAEDAARRLLGRKGAWSDVWRRFEASGGRDHRRVVDLLSVEEPPVDLFSDPVAYPLANTRGEAALRDALRATRRLDAPAAAVRLAELEDAHRWRRETVWGRRGEAPLAEALRHLAVIAAAPPWPAAASATKLAEHFVDRGWKVDDAALAAVALARREDDRAAVISALRAVYAPWLELGACALQAAGVGTSEPLPGTQPGEALVFVDGLRLDLANRLLDRLARAGLEARIDWRWAGVPTSTMTSKPLVTPVADRLSGRRDPAELRPDGPGGKPADHRALRRMMEEDGWAFGEDAAADARLWLEVGTFDADGHAMQARMVDGLDQGVENAAACLVRLVQAGRRVTVVTDHGWLLLPGGLEKAALDPGLAEPDAKRSRSARLKEGARTGYKHVPWTWNAEVQVALATGARTFFACEYAHGGVSPQESVIPVIRIEPTAAGAAAVRILAAAWTGLRLRVEVEGAAGLQIDLRRGKEVASPSVAMAMAVLDAGGRGSLLADDREEGLPAQLVVLDGARVRARREVVVGVD